MLLAPEKVTGPVIRDLRASRLGISSKFSQHTKIRGLGTNS